MKLKNTSYLNILDTIITAIRLSPTSIGLWQGRCLCRQCNRWLSHPMLYMLNPEKPAVGFEVLFMTGSTVHKLLRWFSTFGQNQCIVYCMYIAVAAPFLRSTLQWKPYMLIRSGASIPRTKRNMLAYFLHDNCELFFAGYFLVRLLQEVVKGNFPLFITASDFCHNPVPIL